MFIWNTRVGGQRSTEGRRLRPKAEDFENSASASATEALKSCGRRFGRRFGKLKNFENFLS